MQVETLGPRYTLVTIPTEADQYNISSMATLAAHTPLRLRTGDKNVCECVFMCVYMCVCGGEQSKRAEVVN